MVDLEFVLDQIDVLKSKLDWAQEEVDEAIVKLRVSLENFQKIQNDINSMSDKIRTKLL
jgi:hypothetical protein